MYCGQFYDAALSLDYSPDIRFMALQSYLTAPYLFRQIKEACGSCADKSIADIGSGIGMLPHILENEKYSRIVSADLDINFLNAAKKLTASRGPSAFINADGAHLPFLDSVFDLVFVRYVFQHVGLSEDFISELRRIIKTGGKLVIMDIEENLNVFYPGLPESSKNLFKKYSEYQELKGGDRNISIKLPAFLSRNGFGGITVKPYSDVFFGEEGREDLNAAALKNVFLLIQNELELVKERLIERKLMSLVDFHKGLNDYFRFLNSGKNLFVSKTEFLIAGVKTLS